MTSLGLAVGTGAVEALRLLPRGSAAARAIKSFLGFRATPAHPAAAAQPAATAQVAAAAAVA